MKRLYILSVIIPGLIAFTGIDPCKAQNCQASFTFIITGNTVNFTSTSTGTNSGTVYYWSYGDNSYGSGQNSTHTYQYAGTYMVCLTIYDSMFCQSVFCDSVTVTQNPPPVCNAGFTFTVSGNTVVFTNTSTGGNSPYYYWSFGDINSSNATNPSHTYANAGTYLVCLTMYDTTCLDTVCQSVTVGSSGIGEFDANLIGFQCFPNPAKDLANILLECRSETEVNIHVLDLGGRRVKTIFTGRAETGLNEYMFSTSNIAPGIYVIDVRTGKGNLTQKLTVIQ